MIIEFGTFALCLALCLSFVQGLSGLAGLNPHWRYWGRFSDGAARAAMVLTILAFGILIYAFVVSDFSVANVAAHSHTKKPLLYKISGAWASHEGSMVLWDMLLCLYGGAVSVFGKSLPMNLRHRVLGVQGVMASLFIGFTLFTSNPLARLDPAPIEGASLNPVLQDPALAFHPPLLYLGYVGMSVVFAFAMAALMNGRMDRAWARWVRPWTLMAWCFLTLGITLGAFWAYYELGWGGWWFWDPVENASFMPWLAATALLHSAIVMEKREGLKAWTLFLGLIAFTFSMLGAFLVRSGVLTSVHAFAVDPKRGIVLLAILLGVSGAGFGLYGWRVASLPRSRTFATISRESFLLINNILISAALATVCLGTLYPLILEAMGGGSVSVGAPYFVAVFGPIMAAALTALPMAIALKWKRDQISALGVRLGIIALIALGFVGIVALSATAQPDKDVTWLIGIGLGGWLIAGTLADIIKRGGGRIFKTQPLSFFGQSLAHIGLGLFILGAAYETHGKLAEVHKIPEGGGFTLHGHTIRLEGVTSVDGPNYTAIEAQISLKTPQGQTVCQAKPERRFYPASHQTTSEVWLCYEGLDDYYFVLGEATEREGLANTKPLWQIRALFNPWIRLIFFGPLLMFFGGVLSLWDRRRQRPLLAEASS